jgi:hypothetical protein
MKRLVVPMTTRMRIGIAIFRLTGTNGTVMLIIYGEKRVIMCIKRMIILCNIAILLLMAGCQHFKEKLKFDIGIEYNERNESRILFETKEGCSKTNFKFTDIFIKEIQRNTLNCFIASDFIEYENTIKKYFEMDFFETITQEYFNENNLIVLLFTSRDEDIFKNSKFTKTDNNQYVFEIDVYDDGTPVNKRKKCYYDKVFIIEKKK